MKVNDQENYAQKHIEVTTYIQNLWERIGDVPPPDVANYSDFATLCVIASYLASTNRHLEEWINKGESHGN